MGLLWDYIPTPYLLKFQGGYPKTFLEIISVPPPSFSFGRLSISATFQIAKMTKRTCELFLLSSKIFETAPFKMNKDQNHSDRVFLNLITERNLLLGESSFSLLPSDFAQKVSQVKFDETCFIFPVPLSILIVCDRLWKHAGTFN